MPSVIDVAANLLLVLFGLWLVHKVRRRKREIASVILQAPEPDHALLMRLTQPSAKPKFEFRFSLQRFLFSASAIAVGVAMIITLLRARDGYMEFFCFFGCCPMIGIGLLNLFGRPVLGAAAAFVLQLAALLLFFIWYLFHPVIG
jgi:hypothetical protein